MIDTPMVTVQLRRAFTINGKTHPPGDVLRLSADVAELLLARQQALLLPAGALRRQ